MKTVYLSNGQKAELIKKVDDNSFFVQPVIICDDGDGGYEILGEKTLVEIVFEKPPIPAIDKEFRELKAQSDKLKQELKEMNAELYRSRGQVELLQKQKTSVEKMIYNRSELKTAKRITLFPEDKIVPMDINEKMQKCLKLSIELNIFSGEENMWGSVRAYGDGYYDSGIYIDPQWGMVVDASDEEIMEIARKRVASKNDWTAWTLTNTPDEYLTPELIQKKGELKQKEKSDRIAKIEKEIAGHQKELEELIK